MLNLDRVPKLLCKTLQKYEINLARKNYLSYVQLRQALGRFPHSVWIEVSNLRELIHDNPHIASRPFWDSEDQLKNPWGYARTSTRELEEAVEALLDPNARPSPADRPNTWRRTLQSPSSSHSTKSAAWYLCTFSYLLDGWNTDCSASLTWSLIWYLSKEHTICFQTWKNRHYESWDLLSFLIRHDTWESESSYLLATLHESSQPRMTEPKKLPKVPVGLVRTTRWPSPEDHQESDAELSERKLMFYGSVRLQPHWPSLDDTGEECHSPSTTPAISSAACSSLFK